MVLVLKYYFPSLFFEGVNIFFETYIYFFWEAERSVGGRYNMPPVCVGVFDWP